MNEFEEYIRQGEPEKRLRAENWQTAIGLQDVDGLKTSAYLHEVACRNIEGELTIDEVRENLQSYYKSRQSRTEFEKREEEADKVSANITKLLASPTFAFTYAGLTAIHRHIFEGVFTFAGTIREYDITKKEWVLEGDTVSYVYFQDIRRAIEYDLEQERIFEYKGLTHDEIIKHIALFISGIWQIHPFAEGNTRTIAVFAIKYLRSLGFEVDNELFSSKSWYFRNALVRANYRNIKKEINPDISFLEKFFRNLLLGEHNELKSRYCHINWKEDNQQYTEQVELDNRTSTEQVPNKYQFKNLYIKQLVETIGKDKMTIKEILEKLNLKHRPNFIELYLKPAIDEGFVCQLYPESPHHPRQRYLLTVKGLMLLGN